MIQIDIKYLVVGHHTRRNTANALAESLNASLLIDEADHGAAWNHRRAIEWSATQGERVVILEDDAMPVAKFKQGVRHYLNRFPDHLVSFYLGTGRPPQYQMQIAERLIFSDKCRNDYITLPRLIHGVCYSIPQHHITRVLERWDKGKPADYAIGDAYGGDVIYPCYSLVDHADLPIVERHPDNEPRKERRRAWRLAQQESLWQSLPL